jgi:translocation and assembly module TamA
LYKKLDGAIFQDFGLLIKDSIQDASDNLMAGTGFGLRYQTVIGPVRFDIAWKWRRVYKDFEPLYVWFLSLGHAF